jgi:hypothetical protein
MPVSLTDAKGQLTELVRQVEARDEVVLTRHGAHGSGSGLRVFQGNARAERRPES